MKRAGIRRRWKELWRYCSSIYYLGVNWQEEGRYQEKEEGVQVILLSYLLSGSELA